MIKCSFKQKLKFFISTAWTLTVCFFDLWLTFVGSPDLKSEANPLIQTLGLGWIALIIYNIIWFIACIALYYYSFILFKPDLIKCKGFKQYMSVLYFGEPDKYIRTLYKKPKLKRANKYILACGGCLALAVNIARCRALLEWICIIFNKELAYRIFSFFDDIAFVSFLGRFDMLLLMIIVVIVTYIIWFYFQYRKNIDCLENTDKH